MTKSIPQGRIMVGIFTARVFDTMTSIALKQVSLAIFQILPPDPIDEEISHVALLSMPRLLVTFSTFTQTTNVSTGYQLVTQYMKQKERVPQPSSSGLLLAWLQFHVRRTSRAIRELRLATVKMDEEMDEDRINFDFEQLVEAKNCLLPLLYPKMKDVRISMALGRQHIIIPHS